LICTASRALLAAALFVCALGTAAAQQTSGIDQQLAHVEFGISGAGALNRSVSGPILPTGAPNYNVDTTQKLSNTFGVLGNIRYTPRPYFGLEFNYGWARYTNTFTPSPFSPQPGQPPVPGSFFPVQVTANEYSLGYVITPPHQIFGLQPFISAGAGSTEFKPTGGGGESLPKQARATYYYNVGLQQTFNDSHFGFRVAFRQNFFLAPDFGQNYLTILQHTSTIQPNAGFFLRF
jgi:hypothetical protein